jgi:hypothetical protein
MLSTPSLISPFTSSQRGEVNEDAFRYHDRFPTIGTAALVMVVRRNDSLAVIAGMSVAAAGAAGL